LGHRFEVIRELISHDGLKEVIAGSEVVLEVPESHADPVGDTP